jgi:rhodanese-related sulfurtransferase
MKGTDMASFNAISADKLLRLIGTAAAPLIVDVRPDPSELLPAALRRSADKVAEWAGLLPEQPVVVCDSAGDVSAGVAAQLRCEGVDAETLEGGFEAWRASGHPTVATAKLPRRDGQGRTLWVTRARPKVDRIACPWLIRRFVDPLALILYVAPAEVAAVAERFGAAPFDVEGAEWSDRDGLCTFDALVNDLGLTGFPALLRLAEIIRGADTAQPDLTPQSAGLLALSLGLSRMRSDDLEQLDDGMVLYDALYRWCRDALDETHEPPAHMAKRPR